MIAKSEWAIVIERPARPQERMLSISVLEAGEPTQHPPVPRQLGFVRLGRALDVPIVQTSVDARGFRELSSRSRANSRIVSSIQ